MYRPCVECWNRYGRQCSEACDDFCEFAYQVKKRREAEDEVKILDYHLTNIEETLEKTNHELERAYRVIGELTEGERERLVILPCKIGDVVYRVCKRRYDVDGYGMQWEEDWDIVINAFRVDMLDEIGKNVFLTKEEAGEYLLGKVSKEDLVLVKASNGLHLNQVVDRLK